MMYRVTVPRESDRKRLMDLLFKGGLMKSLSYALLIVAVILGIAFFKSGSKIAVDNEVLNVWNTVSPILTQICEEKGAYENVQIGGDWAKGGSIIYKREKNKSGWCGCITGYGNYYYVRLYDWKWIDGKLFYRVTKDIPLDCYSCIDEAKIRLPYYDKQLAEASIGEVFERGTSN